MSRKQAFTNPVECARWMLEKPGERWVKDEAGIVYKGVNGHGLLDIPAGSYPPLITIRDEHGDIPDEPGYGPIFEHYTSLGIPEKTAAKVEAAIRDEVKAMKQRGEI